MVIEFSGRTLYWRGPGPWYLAPMPAKRSRAFKAISPLVTYGWGVIPVHVRIGRTE